MTPDEVIGVQDGRVDGKNMQRQAAVGCGDMVRHDLRLVCGETIQHKMQRSLAAAQQLLK